MVEQPDEPERVCGNCKHWRKLEDAAPVPFGECHNDTVARMLNDAPSPDADFGCNQWQAPDANSGAA